MARSSALSPSCVGWVSAVSAARRCPQPYELGRGDGDVRAAISSSVPVSAACYSPVILDRFPDFTRLSEHFALARPPFTGIYREVLLPRAAGEVARAARRRGREHTELLGLPSLNGTSTRQVRRISFAPQSGVTLLRDLFRD